MADNNITTTTKLVDRVWETLAERRVSDACRKEIWIVVGNAFSKKHFFKKLNDSELADDESIQAFSAN